MSPPMELTHSNMAYIPTSDALERHEFAVTKHRKTASTGGGRAWSEDEVSGISCGDLGIPEGIHGLHRELFG